MSIEAVIASPGYSLLKLALDASNLRQQVTAQNIANVATEGYQPLKVSFEEQLQRESVLSRGGATSIATSGLQPRVEADTSQGAVSLDREMIQMTKNFIHYQALLKALNGKYELTGLALNDGKR